MINGRTVITTLLSVSLGTIALAQSTHQHGASNAPGMPGMMAQMRGSQAGHMEGMMQAGNSMHGLEELNPNYSCGMRKEGFRTCRMCV